MPRIATEGAAPLPRERAREVWALVALAVILLFNLLFTPHFFSLQIRQGHLLGSLIDVVHRAAPIALMAIGMTFAIATKGIDISVGSVAAVSGAVAATLIVGHQPLWVVVGGRCWRRCCWAPGTGCWWRRRGSSPSSPPWG